MLKNRLPNGLKWTVSSVDPNKWAMTAKGFMVALTPLVLFSLGYFKIEVGENWWANATEIVYNTLTALVAFIGGAMTIYGGVRIMVLPWFVEPKK